MTNSLTNAEPQANYPTSAPVETERDWGQPSLSRYVFRATGTYFVAMPIGQVYPTKKTVAEGISHTLTQEDLWDMQAYDQAKASDDEIIPFAQAVAEIERKRK